MTVNGSYQPIGEISPLLEHFPAAPDLEPRPRAKDLHNRVIILVLLLVVAVDIPSLLQSAPRTRFFEIIYCRRFYEKFDPSFIGDNGVVDEQYCKRDSIQAQVAFLKGWLTFFEHLPGFFLAIPFGMLADKFGRKWLMVMNMAMVWLQAAWLYLVCTFPEKIPIRAAWFQGAFQIFGGGGMVATALLFVIVNDVTPQSKSSSVFFRIGAANMLCYFISPPLSGYLMERDPWIPLALGLGLQLLTIPIALVIPETLGVRKEDDETSDLDEMHTDPSALNSPSLNLQKRNVFDIIRTLLISFIKDSALLLKDWRVLFFMAIYPFRMACSTLDSFLIQYVPKRYHWTFAQTNYIWSIQSGASMLTLIFILPAMASYLLNKKSYSATKKDLLIMRMSFTCFALGYLLEGLAPNIYILVLAAVVANLGSGLGACMRALLTSFIRKDQVARLYTALAIVETLGMMVSGPIVAGLFNGGMKKGNGVWLGFPWLVVGSALTVLSALTWGLRLGGKGEDENEGVDAVFAEGLERAEEVSRPEMGSSVGL